MRWLGSSGLALPSIMVGLLSLEIGCRLMLGPPALRHWQNFVLKARLEARNRKNAQRDSAYRGRPLGVPTPGAARSLPSAWDVPASTAGSAASAARPPRGRRERDRARPARALTAPATSLFTIAERHRSAALPAKSKDDAR